MKWKKVAIEDLQKYRGLKDSLTNIRLRIEALNSKKYGLKGAQTDRVPVSGGSTHYEDFLIDSMAETERLEMLLEANRKLVELTERGLRGLSEKERTVLDKFYINRRKGYLDELMDDLIIEKAQVYRLKDAALEKFTCSMYGIEEF